MVYRLRITFNTCKFSDNTAHGFGGSAVYMQYCDSATFANCSVENNKEVNTGGAGAVAFYGVGTEENPATITNCTFSGNTAAYGGALWLSNSFVKLTDNQFTKNRAEYGGGALYINQQAHVDLTGDIVNNHAGYGGAIYCYQSYVTINGDLRDNTATSDGGGIFCSQHSLTVNGEISGNRAAGYGGAIYSKWTPVTINGTIVENKADVGGGIYILNNDFGEQYEGPITLANAQIYNNTADTAAADIYSGAHNKIVFSEPKSGLILNDCNHFIDGWYTDSSEARWACGSDDVTAQKAGTFTDEMALIAAHSADSNTVTITPADITIYTGGAGYGSVVDANGEPLATISSTNGLPEPGYHLTLSSDVQEWLANNGVRDGEDLSGNLKFTYEGTDTNGDPVNREWVLEYAGIYDTERNVYTLKPTNDSNPAVRLMYFDDADGDGKLGTGETVIADDQIDMSESSVSEEYAMTINPGTLDQSTVQAVFTVNGSTFPCNVKVGTGELTVKSVTDQDTTSEILTSAPSGDTTTITAVDNGNITYYVNDSKVEVDAERVKLLVDEVSNNTDYNEAMASHAISKVYLTNADCEAKYLDLVDTQNGNAVVTASDGVTIYWPVPEGAQNASNFYIVHYTNMDRSAITSEDALNDQETEIIEGSKTADGKYITFTADSFSPFVLVWEEQGSTTPGTGGGGGTTYYTLKYESNGGTAYDDERYTSNTVVDLDKVPSREGYTFTGWYADAELTEQISEIKMTSNKTVYAGWEVTGVPDWLNGDDHFAYVIGYSDGTVKPLNNISRAEVATIFFRLLKPEIRDEYLTQTSQFTDVSADAWYNTAVSTMAALGIVNGRTADTFAPDASITRAEFAAICARFDTNKRDGDSNFSDIAGHWAEAEIERAATLGWINGYSDGTFHPDNAITRAEAMTMINRVLQRLPETEDDLLDDMNVWPDNQPSAWYYLAVQEATNSHDFDRKDDGVHETWTSRNTDPDWMQYQ